MENNSKVLVIDDEAPIRRVLELKLKNRGFQVLLAENGQAGLDIIKTQKPDVVISDINMPIMDGRTLCEKSNGLKKNGSFLTIIITARINPEDLDWVVEMQDTVFMEKPFSPSRVVDAIDQYIGDQG